MKADGPASGVPFADVLRRANLRLVTGSGKSEATFGNPKPKFSTHSFGCHFVEVTWQPEIARLRVSRVVTVIDAGRILNPLAGRNQIEGAVVMGIGMALFEHTTYDPQNGAPINSNLADYIVAVNADAPPIDVHFLDYPDKEINELGARGIGEIGLAGIAAAITAAAHHATGVRVRELPVKIEDLLDIVSFGLTNESIAADHPARRRISFAAVGPCNVGSNAKARLIENLARACWSIRMGQRLVF